VELNPETRRDGDILLLMFTVDQARQYTPDPNGTHCVQLAGGQAYCEPMTLNEYLQE
jgi:hypothetical protein